MIKTYSCPEHGEFEHECSINDRELKECPKSMGKHGLAVCAEPVTRVYKTPHYSWKCDGFYGKGFD